MGFKKGDPNINRKGRPPNPIRTQLRKAIEGKITYEEVADLVIRKAKQGDLKALQMLLDYSVGKAITEVEATVNPSLHVDDIKDLINFKKE